MKATSALLGMACIVLTAPRTTRAQEATLTDSLARAFTDAWDANDLPRMLAWLQPDAFFKSPHQLRYGRDVMEATVLTTNPPAFRDTRVAERYSKVGDSLAWSIGTMTGHVYDAEGHDTGQLLQADYLYVFTRGANGLWKLQMMVFQNEKVTNP